MDVKELGGEFALIDRIRRAPQNKDVVCGIGDDAAVLSLGGERFVVTTDTLVENDHFSMDYFTPRQVGVKAMESNLSDVAAMGGTPLYALVALALPKNISVEWVDGFYEGLYASASRAGVDVVGGDTTHSTSQIMVTVTLIGKAGDNLCLRSSAKAGDLVFVTGNLGASTAGLKLFQKKVPGFDFVKQKHAEPKSRLDVSSQIAQFAHAVEDVSDGLASEIRNITRASGTGAVIDASAVPIDVQTRKAAQALGSDALEYALFGGEDFELVFTVSTSDQKKAEALGTCVGRIIQGEGVSLEKNGVATRLQRFGYDHFA
ncbi:thiamine-phosphate kinase [Candidatus Micrarchaeota archaeon]|nr:thiamine-phosphate kinase [Candidatus Micrarchaeota archaeon]